MRRYQRQLAGSCSRPTFGRMLGSDAVFSLVLIPLSLAATAAGVMIGVKAAATPDDRAKTGFAGGMIGGTVGTLIAALPAAAAQRAVLRSPGCPDPSFGRVYGYSLGKLVATGLLGNAGHALAGNAGRAVAMGVGYLATVPVGQAIVKEGA